MYYNYDRHIEYSSNKIISHRFRPLNLQLGYLLISVSTINIIIAKVTILIKTLRHDNTIRLFQDPK